MSEVRGWRDAVSLHGNPLARVDEAANGLRERQHRPVREELFKLIAILSGKTFGQGSEAMKLNRQFGLAGRTSSFV